MKKRILALALAMCTMATVVGCGNKEISNEYITITQYKGLEVEVETFEVSEEAIQQTIETDMQTIWEEVGIKDREAKDGDTVVIDYVGTKDGEAFEGGTSTSATFLTLGSNSFIDGFEEGIVGKMPGTTFDLDLTFPEEYQSAELAGQDVVFEVTFHAILPEFSEEYVPLLTDDKCKTVEEYKEMIIADQEASNAESVEADIPNKVIEALLAQCTVKEYPTDRMEEYTNNVKMNVAADAEASGMTEDEFVQNNYGQTIEQMVQEVVKQELALELIAQEEEMTVSQTEYDAVVEQYVSYYGITAEEVEEYMGEDFIKKAALQEEVTNFLVENCVRVEPKAEEDK